MAEPPFYELQSLTPSSVIELFELSEYDSSNPLRTERFTNERVTVVFQGFMYQAMPLESSGWEYKSTGTLPRPTLRFSNVLNFVANKARDYDDLIGAKIVRKRTLVKYLDGQPTADPNVEFPPDIYYVQRKSLENREVIEFELSSIFDLEGLQLPKRRMVASVCMWRYRSAECGYVGGPVALPNDTPTSNPDLDRCGKQLSSCRLRFGEHSALPFGAFPGLRRIR